jgi:hypothetical protein
MAFVLRVDVFLQMSKGPIVADVENWDLGIELSYCVPTVDIIKWSFHACVQLYNAAAFSFLLVNSSFSNCQVDIAKVQFSYLSTPLGTFARSTLPISDLNIAWFKMHSQIANSTLLFCQIVKSNSPCGLPK